MSPSETGCPDAFPLLHSDVGGLQLPRRNTIGPQKMDCGKGCIRACHSSSHLGTFAQDDACPSLQLNEDAIISRPDGGLR